MIFVISLLGIFCALIIVYLLYKFVDYFIPSVESKLITFSEEEINQMSTEKLLSQMDVKMMDQGSMFMIQRKLIKDLYLWKNKDES